MNIEVLSYPTELTPAAALDELTESDAEDPHTERQRTVFVVDDDPVVRDSLQWLIESVGLDVRTFASSAEFLEAYDPDVTGCLVLDVRMPGISGLDLQAVLHERGYQIPIVIVTGYADVPMAIRAMKNGAMEFLQKPYSDQRLLDVVQRAILHDSNHRAAQLRKQEIRKRLNSLTPREMEILKFVSEGLASRKVADQLQISSKTVETHRTNIMKKMQASNVAQLIRFYLEGRPEAP